MLLRGGRDSLDRVLLCSEFMGAGKGVAFGEAAAFIPWLPLTCINSRSQEASWRWKSMELLSREAK